MLRKFLTENSIEQLINLGVGTALVSMAAPTAGAPMMVSGAIGLSAIVGGQLIAVLSSREKDARAAFDKAREKTLAEWARTGGEDEAAGREVAELLNGGADRIEFPIEDVRRIAKQAGRAETIPDALADLILARIPDGLGLLRQEPHRTIAIDCLATAVREGLLASDALQGEVILAVLNETVRLQRETLEAVRTADADSKARDAQTMALLQQIADQTGRTQAAVDQGIPERAVRDVVERLGGLNVAKEDLVEWLDQWIARTVAELERLKRASNLGDAFDVAMAQARALLAEGNVASAADPLLARLKAIETEEADRAARVRAERISLHEEAIALKLLALDVKAAADLSEAAAVVEGATVRQRAVASYKFGRDKGDNSRLLLAIELWSRLGALNDLGAALQTLGERESGKARLEEAVVAYRAALEERNREIAPLDWAKTQNNLGIALQALGERESGSAQLEEAVVAYRAALEERTRARVPLDWAMTQNNLGNALSILGARESGTARLEEAVISYRAALEERTRARVPLDWAMTQSNLGNVLLTLGARESGTARLEEAVGAYRAALTECTRAKVPLKWAATQNNLGRALQALGERASGTARLEEAVTACRAALEEYTRDKVPLAWAMTTGNKARAETLIAQRTGDCALAQASVAALEQVVELSVEAGHQPFVANYSSALEQARAAVAELCAG